MISSNFLVPSNNSPTGAITAAVIAPVGELFDGTKKLELIKDDKPGEWTQKIYNLLTGIQLGKVEDKFGWVVKVEE